MKGDDLIAWVDGRWLNRDEREELFELYDEYFFDAIISAYGDDPAKVVSI